MNNNKSLITSAIVSLLALIVVVIGIPCALIAGSYNKMVTAQENVDSAYADIQTQLQRRADLIPNLVNTVSGYMEHENEVINSITESREKLLGASNITDMADASEELSSALNSLMVIVENYPDLKSNENFIQLQDELAGTENRIATSRRDYNDIVRKYNSTIKVFPGVIVARLFGFDAAPYFEASPASQTAPEVSFN